MLPDIRLDSPLHGLARYEGLPIEEVRTATRSAFDNLIACDKAVDFVLIACVVLTVNRRSAWTLISIVIF